MSVVTNATAVQTLQMLAVMDGITRHPSVVPQGIVALDRRLMF
jgi:hypothetical protein